MRLAARCVQRSARCWAPSICAQPRAGS